MGGIVMATTKPTEANRRGEPTNDNQERPLTIAERLAKSGEVFFEGSPDSSDRTDRKRALYAHWDERHRKRQGE
jgi:hypothetical protein